MGLYCTLTVTNVALLAAVTAHGGGTGTADGNSSRYLTIHTSVSGQVQRISPSSIKYTTSIIQLRIV